MTVDTNTNISVEDKKKADELNRIIENIADMPCINCRYQEQCDSSTTNPDGFSTAEYSPITCQLLAESVLYNYNGLTKKLDENS